MTRWIHPAFAMAIAVAFGVETMFEAASTGNRRTATIGIFFALVLFWIATELANDIAIVGEDE